jgi:hypothetical protein
MHYFALMNVKFEGCFQSALLTSETVDLIKFDIGSYTKSLAVI